jgi:hypothetical protein
VRADLIFGLDTKLFSDVGQVELAMGAHAHVTQHQQLEVDLLQVRHLQTAHTNKQVFTTM